MAITLIIVTLVASYNVLSTVPNPFFFSYYLILFSKHSLKLSTVEIHIFKVKKNKFRGIFNITQAVNVGPI